jgi:uncharacterized protein HemX
MSEPVLNQPTPPKTPTQRGVRTALQTVGGTIVAYFTGLLALPAVREYTESFIQTQGVAALLLVLTALGLGAGAVAFVQNLLETRKK